MGTTLAPEPSLAAAAGPEVQGGASSVTVWESWAVLCWLLRWTAQQRGSGGGGTCRAGAAVSWPWATGAPLVSEGERGHICGRLPVTPPRPLVTWLGGPRMSPLHPRQPGPHEA